jgi:hypothetical protein
VEHQQPGDDALGRGQAREHGAHPNIFAHLPVWVG